MPQEQKQIDVIPLKGEPWKGITTGNNASWQCGCYRETWLIGRSGTKKGATEKSRVECPQCLKNYFVVPKSKDFDSVQSVKEINWSASEQEE